MSTKTKLILLAIALLVISPAMIALVALAYKLAVTITFTEFRRAMNFVAFWAFVAFVLRALWHFGTFWKARAAK
jgi:hypothetical protein